ncbi:selenocysteine-specific translation elongation factor, partial [Acidobacteriota bacterium]
VFIDVPGHEKLVRTMVAGASNIDGTLLVIAADEGINIQTREHFDILRILDIPGGVIALTKSDLVDDRQIQELTESTRIFVQGTFLEKAEIIPVSASTGAGVEDIRNALIKISRKIRPRDDTGIFRMPVDRIFTIQGFGTVIAGTVLSGQIKAGDEIEILPERIKTKVRGVQVHHEKADHSRMGKRTALNLLGVEKDRLRRGQCVGQPDALWPTNRVDATLQLLHSGKEIKNRTRLRFHTGTSETICRIVLLDRNSINPGETAPVQFVLEGETVTLPGDRFVIRTFSPLVTVGGGTILDADPSKHKRFDEEALAGVRRMAGSAREQTEQLVLKSGYFSVDPFSIIKKSGKDGAQVSAGFTSLVDSDRIYPIGGGSEVRYIHTKYRDRIVDKIEDAVRSHLDKHPDRLSIPFSELRSSMLRITDESTFRSILESLIDLGRIYRKGQEVGITGYKVDLTDKESQRVKQLEQMFLEAGFEAPLEEALREELNIQPPAFKKLITSMINSGKIVRLSDKVIYHKKTLDRILEIVLQFISKNHSITIAQLRDELGLSRKYTQAILEYMDATGITERSGDLHVLPKDGKV